MTVNQARRRAGVFTFISLAFLAGCGPDAAPPDRSAAAPDRAGQTLRFVQTDPAPGEQVAARVGGTVITVEDVRREAAVRELVTDAEALNPDDAVFGEALDELVDQRLLALEAARRSLQTTPEARRRLAAAEERILGNVLVEQAVSDAVTEEAIARVYEEQSRLAPPAEEIRARHILVDTREEADEVARLLAEGTDFAQLAARVSQDPATRFEGGDLGYFTREGILPAFARAAFATPVGAVSDPFQTEYGWHVVTVTDRRSQPRPDLEAMRGNIVRFLTLEGIDALLAEIRETYPVTVLAGAGAAQAVPAPEASGPDAPEAAPSEPDASGPAAAPADGDDAP